ncbi:MAG: FHA domain-containing protein [Acidobacteria bacterium]|nr:MAG: FHA domain-containing protein [Acidobacteriota bacterium]REK02555.1 MAG: FHA domain-containing protein [Acidobacteriota bacterium]REK13642.1 MAG: FHA domain-containing protein [Acidobacteriota bacterium]REK41636.1 MAG: FHA domain-containing protein [Acidobacteriota bacterium]
MTKARIRITFSDGKEKRIDLKETRTLVGRGDDNDIRLRHPSISRKHFVIASVDGRFVIDDLGSLNGTLVGDKPAENYELKDGDRIMAGDFTMIFERPEERGLRFCDVEIDNDDSVLLPEEFISVDLDNVVATIARDLNAILKVTAKINAIHDVEELQKELLSEILEVVPATSGAIILVDDEMGLAEVSGLNKSGSNENVHVSRTIINRVIDEKNGVLANDIVNDSRQATPESVAVAGVSSLLCVPMYLFDKVHGVIYLSTSAEGESFDDSHLRFMTAVASIASIAIENARNFSTLQIENAKLKTATSLEKQMIGDSEAMKRVYGFIAKAAPSDATILIEGESGTGKELAAKAIVVNSRRKDKPLVTINCATLTENLLESELFGHEKGAFTGALTQKKGKIEIAHGGTLFLDEVGELPLGLQAKLLRVIQERELERVGGIEKIGVDVRIIAATNRDLEEEVKNGGFRQDLFYRLNVMKFRMPALRERRSDVMLLAEAFLWEYARKNNRQLRGFSASAKERLLNYEYPGNVRELENAVERAVILSSGEWVAAEDLPEEFSLEGSGAGSGGDGPVPLQEGVKLKKKQMIIEAFRKAEGSYVDTAKILDVHPNYLHRLIKTLGIKEELESL